MLDSRLTTRPSPDLVTTITFNDDDHFLSIPGLCAYLYPFALTQPSPLIYINNYYLRSSSPTQIKLQYNNMDGYIRGLKREAEQMLSEVEEAKESGRRELNDIDHQIIELVRKKDEQKAKIDKKVKALKDQADAKLEMYNKVTGVRYTPRRTANILLTWLDDTQSPSD